MVFNYFSSFFGTESSVSRFVLMHKRRIAFSPRGRLASHIQRTIPNQCAFGGIPDSTPICPAFSLCAAPFRVIVRYSFPNPLRLLIQHGLILVERAFSFRAQNFLERTATAVLVVTDAIRLNCQFPAPLSLKVFVFGDRTPYPRARRRDFRSIVLCSFA